MLALLLRVQIPLLLLVVLPHMLLLTAVAPPRCKLRSKCGSSILTAKCSSSKTSSSTATTGSALDVWHPHVLLQQLVHCCHDARQVHAHCDCPFDVLADTPRHP
jgi:hypothetical protein